MLVQDFQKQLTWYTSEDGCYLEKVRHRLCGKNRKDRKFVEGLPKINESQAEYINGILRSFIDNPLGEQLFSKQYNQTSVIDCLEDREFAAFVIQSRLYDKLIMLQSTSDAEEKLRIYAAILNFNAYKYAH